MKEDLIILMNFNVIKTKQLIQIKDLKETGKFLIFLYKISIMKMQTNSI